MSFNDVAIVSIERNDYRVYSWCMSKNDAIPTNSDLNDKNGIL